MNTIHPLDCSQLICSGGFSFKSLYFNGRLSARPKEVFTPAVLHSYFFVWCCYPQSTCKEKVFFTFVSVLLLSASVLPSIWSVSWAWKSTPRLTPTPSYSPAHRFASQRLQTPWCLSSMHPCLAHYPWVLFNTNTLNLLCLWSLSCQVTSLCRVPRCWTNGVSRQRWWRDWLSTVP